MLQSVVVSVELLEAPPSSKIKAGKLLLTGHRMHRCLPKYLLTTGVFEKFESLFLSLVDRHAYFNKDIGGMNQTSPYLAL